ncbi:hypothetical protein [Hydrogenimonas sp.]|uniref:hypothetical protein n=1 Tax=Hydrogenimonas sp. TaxID=2231112 RepID=UPI002612720E|nr:hypothetical protein [Hydrogenimonas sp.]
MDEKRREKYLQTRYKRELERYLNRVVNFAQQEGGERSDYDAFIEKVSQKLDGVEKVAFYNDYFEKLEQFIELTQRMCASDLDVESIKSRILHEANQIRKAKRKKSYNRKNHRTAFDDDF